MASKLEKTFPNVPDKYELVQVRMDGFTEAYNVLEWYGCTPRHVGMIGKQGKQWACGFNTLGADRYDTATEAIEACERRFPR